ncbi:MAG: hypothetical protein ACR2G8_01420 [Candidatus Limnocylindria bacterium]
MLSEELLTKIRAAGRSAPSNLQDANGSPFNLSRATHRKEHLDEIERRFERLSRQASE